MTINKKSVFHWTLSLVLLVGILLIPTTEAFTFQIKLFFAITVFGVSHFCMDELDNGVVGLLMMTCYLIFGLGSWSTVFSAFTSENAWMLITSFILINAVNDTTIFKRIAYFCFSKFGNSYNGIVISIAVVAVLCMVVIPQTGTVLAIAAFIVGIIRALDLKEGKATTCFMLVGCMCAHSVSFYYYMPTTYGMFLSFSSGIVEMSTTYLSYLWTNLPFILAPVIMVIAYLKIWNGKDDIPDNAKAIFIEERKNLGPMTKEEKKFTAILLLLMIYLFTSNIHGQNMAYGFLVACIALYLPGIKVGKQEYIQNIPWGMCFFFATCIAIGSVAGSLGAATFLSNLLLQLLGNISNVAFLVVGYIFAVIVNFILTPGAAMASLSPVLAQMSLDIGLNPEAIVRAFYLGLEQVFIPYEATSYLLCFSVGYLTLKNFVKGAAVKFVVYSLLFILLVIPWWTFIGFI